jgi:hypothetical protein
MTTAIRAKRDEAGTPPRDDEAERACLGSLLIDQAVIADVMDVLQPSDFYRQSHGIIYSAALRLYEKGQPADVVLLAEELDRAGELQAVGGASYLSALGNDTPTSVHAVQYAKVVARKAVMRRLIGAAGRIAAIGYEDGGNPEEAVQRATAELLHLQATGRTISRDFKLEKRGLGYFLTWPAQQIEITFTKLKHRSSDTTADVLIVCHLPGINLRDGHVSMGRQNLSAPKGRMDFAKSLQARVKDERIDWQDVIEQAFVAVLVAESKGEPIVDIDGFDEPPEFRSYALDPVAPRGETTVLFAPGGSGKSYAALALALSVQLGIEIIPGIPPAITGPVLYLDWETNAKTVKTRIRKIAGGMGFDPPRIAYRRCLAPLADDAEQLSTEIAKRGIVLVVIDSAGAAIGSQGEYGDANEGALKFFEAIRVLGSDLTVIVIDHVAKPGPIRKGQQPNQNPYGSVYKVNAARSVWSLGEIARGEDDVTCALRHTKVNDSKMYRPISYRLVWSPDGVTPETATFEMADYIAQPGTGSGSVADRAVEFIGNGRQSTSAIAMALGAAVDTVRRSLNRDKRLVRMGNDWMLVDNAPMPMNATSQA